VCSSDLLAVIFSAMFTFSSYNSFCNFGESKWMAYADELPRLIENNSTVLEMIDAPNSWFGYYLKYKCGDRMLFLDKNATLSRDLPTGKIYSSQASSDILNRTIINTPLTERLQKKITANTIWVNGIGEDYNIVKLMINESQLP
jgi:hypothetical protein